MTWHNLRQQNVKPTGKPNLCLADFIAPRDCGVKDYIGAFAVTEVRVAPNYVDLDVLGGGTLYWSPDGPRLWRFWPVASDLPWWYRWVGRPISGRWVAEPVDPRALAADFIR